jgi:clan AA aspartic protease
VQKFFENGKRMFLHLDTKSMFMGMVYADIRLINSGDLEMARRCVLDEDDVRKMDFHMLVDTGAFMLCINENIQAFLQLPFVQKKTGQTADGGVYEYDVVGPVRVEFQDQSSSCNAMVLPGDSEPLLGFIPMGAMDLTISEKEQKLVGKHHPDYPVYRI